MIYKKLIWLTALLALCVVVLGAFVRLSNAGLGCPDWPGCYGQIGAPDTSAQISRAESAFPNRPVIASKAWKEMIHRYFAGTLATLIIVIAYLSWRRHERLGLPVAIVGTVIFQALLGMWTVTLLLRPIVVSAHLLGGMTTLALLSWLGLRQTPPELVPPSIHAVRLRPYAIIALVVICVQICLGGWTSTNYAALACTGFPTCNGQWVPPMDLAHGFQLFRDLGKTASGAPLDYSALVGIHWMHRVGALITFCYVGWLALKVKRVPGFRHLGFVLLALLFAQMGLGIANVELSLPLPVAVAHNAGAALLLVTLTSINYLIYNASNRYRGRS
ncbi:MAG: COX15/CtaA family protein [Pseudomonadota bacterium]|nr:COX15/CtaA family protein [Pseudomonadota bacterium]